MNVNNFRTSCQEKIQKVLIPHTRLESDLSVGVGLIPEAFQWRTLYMLEGCSQIKNPMSPTSPEGLFTSGIKSSPFFYVESAEEAGDERWISRPVAIWPRTTISSKER